MKIQKKRNIFPNHRVARYNLAAWQKPESNSVIFIGREVAKAGSEGEPDVGKLKLFEVNEDGSMVQGRVIWKPMYEGINLEDPRALELPNEILLIGLTAVLRDKAGKPIPFPAIIKIDSHTSWNQELPPFLVITSFGSGKNTTPIDNGTFMFRPDDPRFNHKLLVFSMHSQVPEKLGEIKFPTNLSWAQLKIGTTMPPIWLNNEEALFIVHGITMQEIEGQKKYVYSIGRAKLVRKKNKFEVTVDPEPILTPDDFLDENGRSLVKELHPNLRRVVYSCGGIIKGKLQETLSLYVNVGDMTTFEVEFLLSDLKKDFF